MKRKQPPADLSVSKHTLAADGTITGVYITGKQAAAGDQRVHRITLKNQGTGFAGTHAIAELQGVDAVPDGLEIEIVPVGKIFKLFARAGDELRAEGIGMVDPESADSLLVSWGWDERQATGIVKYTIRPDEPHVVDALYASIVLQADGHDDVMPGVARGNFSNGFPGSHVIMYRSTNDRNWGPYEWEIVQDGKIVELTWTQNSVLAIRGFGFVDPDFSRSLLVNYWAAKE